MVHAIKPLATLLLMVVSLETLAQLIFTAACVEDFFLIGTGAKECLQGEVFSGTAPSCAEGKCAGSFG